ncbi:ciliated left-right organizer metallopeptidase [Acipenser ruthenus]|uniref:ciliated left-right organizer metallopeptidase n=1 Tax=Acipenser ruthenus TaxID=7906 RepID=UPI00145B22EA|nr:ciliated left-right organizer metallopeptidase [Acipenser ruthenus]
MTSAHLSPPHPPHFLSLCLLFLFLRSSTLVVTEGKCLHDEVQGTISVVTPPRRARATPTSRVATPPMMPIRIQTWSLGGNSELETNERERLNKAVGEAVSIISNLLSVNRVSGRLLLNRDINKYCKSIWKNSNAPNYNKCGMVNENYRTETCLDVTIPDDHLIGYEVWSETGPLPLPIKPNGTGVADADFILYVKAADTEKCRNEPSVIAYASYCQADETDRPIAGVVVICRSRLTAIEFNHSKTTLTAVHELLHALGFSKELFDTWKDCSDAPAIGKGCSARGRVTNVDENNLVRIYTQNVIQEMQNQFKSESGELGGPLENKGSIGVPSSHWEARFLQGSIMTASIGEPGQVQLDRVTLAALQDTGWYQVNHSAGEGLVWGAGQGSSFGLMSTCAHSSSHFFCVGSGQGCHYLHLDKGVCDTDDFLEGCRIYKPINNGSECWKEENMKISGAEEWSGEIYNMDSRCFFSNLSKENSGVAQVHRGDLTAGCYLHRCVGENRFQVRVQGTEWINCTAGAQIQIPGYNGVLLCPDGRLCRNLNQTPPTSSQAPAPAPTVTAPPSSSDLYVPLEILFRKVQKGIETTVPLTAQYTGLALGALMDATELEGCHFQNAVLWEKEYLTLELWQFPGCETPPFPVANQRLQSAIQEGRVSYILMGTNYTAYRVNVLVSPPDLQMTLVPPVTLAPSLAPPPLVSPSPSVSVVPVAVVCGSVGALFLLTLLCGVLLTLYKRHLATRMRIHATPMAPPAPPASSAPPNIFPVPLHLLPPPPPYQKTALSSDHAVKYCSAV